MPSNRSRVSNTSWVSNRWCLAANARDLTVLLDLHRTLVLRILLLRYVLVNDYGIRKFKEVLKLHFKIKIRSCAHSRKLETLNQVVLIQAGSEIQVRFLIEAGRLTALF